MLERLPAHIHFVGIGGAGMSGIARVLLEMGLQISGSDLQRTNITKKLEELGATCYYSHSAENIKGADLVVFSSAVLANNPEILAAKKMGIPAILRGDMLAFLAQRQKGIIIAGTHGKTTTTSMMALVLEKNGLNPTIIIGGEMTDIGGNAKLGEGEYLVAESDESDGTFLKLNPYIAIITNIENDHLDFYKTEENILNAFSKFLNQVQSGGTVIACLDDPNTSLVIKNYHGCCFTYGLKDVNADFKLKNINLNCNVSSAEVLFRNQKLGTLTLKVPGYHNLSNALAVMATAHLLGIKFSDASKSLREFKGADRRFQQLGEVKGIKIVDDYAHHPSEIKATLRAARHVHSGRLISVFQPHRYTRTFFLQKQFGDAFKDSDLVIINEIYPAREEPIEGVTAKLIVQAINEQDPVREVVYLPKHQQIKDYLISIAKKGDLILTMGAGNIWNVGVDLLKNLQEN